MPATSKAAARKRGEKPLSIPDLVSVDEQEIGGTGGARIIIRADSRELENNAGGANNRKTIGHF